MQMTPCETDPKTPSEKVLVEFELAGEIGSDTVSGTPTWSSSPTGLTFSGETLADSSRTVQAYVSGGAANVTYTVSALCTLASGGIVEPAVRLPVMPAGTCF